MRIVATPRDAMQGKKNFIPTKLKAEYINCLLKVGFDTIDFGSFVSPKAIPQLSDTVEVLKMLDLSATKTKLLAIVGNLKGAQIGSAFDEISYFGYPFSISNTFLKLNINSNVDGALGTIEEMQNLVSKSNKELVIYFSMAFGNPYGDEHNDDLVINAIDKLQNIGIKTISLADTLGVGDNAVIANSFARVKREFPKIELGMHLHVSLEEANGKIDAAYKAGCRYFDVAMLGMGGCPMSAHDMVGNLSTEQLMEYLEYNNLEVPLKKDRLEDAVIKAMEVFQFD
ncbi:MAG: hydroxymethylglutaryl-CoA lyase [Bacteroidia bacterium]|nr:hydroxymethylglutaryl-CoA lyase [Bacteroidia bacterium]